MVSKKFGRLLILSVFVLLGSPTLGAAQKDHKSEVVGTPVLWRQPVGIEARNLLTGAGGDAMKPDLSKVTWLKDETGGYSTKYACATQRVMNG